MPNARRANLSVPPYGNTRRTSPLFRFRDSRPRRRNAPVKTCREHCFRPFFHTYQARECEKATYKRPFSFMHVPQMPNTRCACVEHKKNQPAFNRFALISLLYIAAYKSVHRPVIWDSAWKAKNGITGFRINSMAFLYTGNRAYSLGFYPRRPQHGQSVRDKTGMNPSFQPFSYDVH